MKKEWTAILLAGTLRTPPLAEQLGMPLLALPRRADESMLSSWLAAIAALPVCDCVRIIVNDEADAAAMRDLLRTTLVPRRLSGAVSVFSEMASWRGAAGLIADASADVAPERMLLIAETSILPPSDTRALAAAIEASGCDGALAFVGRDEPAGWLAMRRRWFESIPPVGYHDLKEQFLPGAVSRGAVVKAVRTGESVHRIRHREGYLAALRADLGAEQSIAPDALVSPHAILEGFCIIEAGATIEDGAVVHESVVQAGAFVGGGAIVSHSLCGAGARCESRQTYIRTVVAGASRAAESRVGGRR